MKQFIILLSLCTLFACKQATSDGKQAESPKKEGIGTDNAKPLSLVSSIIINVSTGGYPSNNKKYTFRNSHPEGDLHQVFFDFNESEGNKNLYDGTYAISMDNNQKAYELLGKVSTIENGKSFDPQGQPCVGAGGRSYNMDFFDGKKANFNASMCPNTTLPTPLNDLNALAESLA